MRKLLLLFGCVVLVGCISNEKEAGVQKKLAVYFEMSANVNLDKNIRMKYIDSANAIIEKNITEDSLKIKNYFKIANRVFMMMEYEQYKNISHKIIKIAKAKNDSLNTAKAEYYLGDYYIATFKNDSAYYYYLAAEKKYKKINDKRNLANTKLHKAYILAYEKDYIGSETETIKVLNIANQLKDDHLIFESYISLGASSSGLGNYEKALEYHKKALAQIKKIEDKNFIPMYQAQALNNIGFVYLNLNKYEEASKIFAEGLKIENIKDIQPFLFTSLLDYYAFSRFKINKKEGLNDFKTALALRDNINDVYGKIISRIHLTEYYLAQNDTLKAIQNNREANALAKESNYNKEVLVTLDFFTKLYPKEGLSYARDYIKLSDSLQNQERATRNKLARIEYETNEIISEKDSLFNQRKVIIIVMIVLLSFGFLLFVILYQRSKHKDLIFKQQQQDTNEEIYMLMLNNQQDIDEVRSTVKRNIALELHDNILNRLAGTRLNLFAISKRQDEETIKNAIKHIDSIRMIEQEIRAFSHELHKESELNKSNFKTILEELLKTQKETYSTECNCEIKFDEAINNLSPEIKMNLYRIIQETFNNINKYSKATMITLSLHIQNAILYLEIIDNGIGFNMKKVKQGIGLKNMKDRAKTMNGEISIVSNPGKGTAIKLKIII